MSARAVRRVRIDRVAEITGNGPRAPVSAATAARAALGAGHLAVASVEAPSRGAYKVLVKPTGGIPVFPSRGASAEIAAASQVGTERAGQEAPGWFRGRGSGTGD